MEELDWPAQGPDLNPVYHWMKWDTNCEPGLFPPPTLISNALVAHWEQMLLAFKIMWKAYPSPPQKKKSKSIDNIMTFSV